jgi:hypothetical protein
VWSLVRKLIVNMGATALVLTVLLANGPLDALSTVLVGLIAAFVGTVVMEYG